MIALEVSWVVFILNEFNSFMYYVFSYISTLWKRQTLLEAAPDILNENGSRNV
jgi:hypothetical protein